MQLVVKEKQQKNIEFLPNTNLEVVLAGVGAKVEVQGIWQGKNDDRFEGNLKIVHCAPETVSKVNIRGVLFGKSQAAFDGLIRIEKGAVGADGFLRADFLLFDQSKARPLPYLEILENQVKAGHAATVTRVDDDQIFYLQTRGISRQEAEKVIVEGFLKNPTSLKLRGAKEVHDGF